MPNTTPWQWFCAKCGIRERVDGRHQAKSKSLVHNNQKHAGFPFASYEQAG